jgi:uncharacterized protein with PIN domain
MRTAKRYRYVTHPVRDDDGWYNWRVFRHGCLDTKSRKKRRALWQLDKVQGETRLYITCTYCGGVNDVTQRSIRSDGFFVSRDCVTCNRCDNHFWPFLSGWKGRRK